MEGGSGVFRPHKDYTTKGKRSWKHPVPASSKDYPGRFKQRDWRIGRRTSSRQEAHRQPRRHPHPYQAWRRSPGASFQNYILSKFHVSTASAICMPSSLWSPVKLWAVVQGKGTLLDRIFSPLKCYHLAMVILLSVSRSVPLDPIFSLS
jgi:hypothetical protein